MSDHLKSFIKPLPLPHSVAGLKRSQVRELLGLSDSQLRRDTWVCQQLQPTGWRYASGARGYGRGAIEVLWVFRQLVSLMGRTEAISQINQIMENYHGDEDRQSSRECC